MGIPNLYKLHIIMCIMDILKIKLLNIYKNNLKYKIKMISNTKYVQQHSFGENANIPFIIYTYNVICM